MSLLKKIIVGFEYIVLKINYEDKSFERFINICTTYDIPVWVKKISSKKQCENKMCICIYHNNLNKIIQLLDKCRINYSIKKAGGIPSLCKWITYNPSTIAGAIVFLIVILYLNLYVWGTNFYGNYKYTDFWLKDILCEHNIMTGTLKKNISCKEIEQSIRYEYPDISFVSVVIDGCYVKMTIKEGMIFETEKENNTNLSIISNCDGEVIKIITREGTAKVKQNDKVSKGDVLVSNEIDLMDDTGNVVEHKYVEADADVIIRTEITKNEIFPKKYYEYKYKDKPQKALYIINDKNKKILYKPFKLGKCCDIMNCKMPNCMLGVLYYYDYEVRTLSYDDILADEKAKKLIATYISQYEQNNVLVVDYDYNVYSDNINYYVDISFVLEGNFVAKSRCNLEE